MEFYKKIRPACPGWKPDAVQLPTVSSPDNLTLRIIAAVLATALVYTILPGIPAFHPERMPEGSRWSPTGAPPVIEK